VTGPGAATMGRLFRRAYARNLDAAIPRLIAHAGRADPSRTPTVPGRAGNPSVARPRGRQDRR
jgi:hypothetical protein